MLKPSKGPLTGIRILDLTTVVMGPFSTQLLGDLGADVIKVESISGDSMRMVGPMRSPAMGSIFLHLNRNKRSVVLDLKSEEGRAACLALAAESDILIYNSRPASMKRMGLSYEEVQAVNPKIVYLGAYGFGEKGPYAGRPAYDDLIQGMVGIGRLYEENSTHEPRYAPLTLADRIMGLHVAVAGLAAVLNARESGIGQAIEIPMFEGMTQFVLGDHLAGRTFDFEAGQIGYQRLLTSYRRPYQTKDGYISLLIYNDKHWQSFLTAIGRAELLKNSIFESHSKRADNIDEVYSFVSAVVAEKSSEEWLSLFKGCDIPSAPLYSVEDLINDEHIKATEQIIEFEHPTEGLIQTTAPLGKFSKTPLGIHQHAPNLGEHTEELVEELKIDKHFKEQILKKLHSIKEQ
ncbi:Formyl-coenzyme A transferase [Oligella ureolytica]|uniref:CaiB/BaiF CoA transferase family protein n=1 Tax=Oligella ureolytica TaxID=90244 RepID=UPI000DFF4C48|nr:CoA transferase [Oligella ureolytica]NLB30853.1 CoA transferase [Alcaligenaceae bacterium]SUA57042.1 Formyl-coenzyme A transferase [Oligella ureolytica]